MFPSFSRFTLLKPGMGSHLGGGGRSCRVMGVRTSEGTGLGLIFILSGPPIFPRKTPRGWGGGRLADGARIGILLSGDAGSARQRGLRS